MKTLWPASLRARLLILVVICTLPAIGLATYTAVQRYHTSIRYAYDINKLAADAIVGRYQSLVSRSHDLLTLMQSLPAVGEPSAECSRELAALKDRMPAYENLDVVSLQGEFLCSAAPVAKPVNVSSRGWFKQVLQTRAFTAAVIPHGLIVHRGLLVFSSPRFDKQGNLIGAIDVAASPQALRPPDDETALSHYAQLAVFSHDGTLLMYYPDTRHLTGSNQSHTALFRAFQNSSNALNRALPGIDGNMRFYTLRHMGTNVPGDELYIASGIDEGVIQRLAFLPLARDLSIIAGIMLFILLGTWWLSTSFITQRVKPLLQTLQKIGTGDWRARTGLGESSGEIGALARGVDGMAKNLEARVMALNAAEQARETSEERYRDLLEQASDSIIVRHVTGELVFVNAALCELLGYSREELLKMRITDLVEESNLRGHRLNIGESQRFESWMWHKDGRQIPVEVSTMRLKNGDIQSIQRDISDRLETQRTLETSERHYRDLVEQAMLGILVLRPTGEIVFANQAICDIAGYSRHELLRMHITSLLDTSDPGAIQRIQQIGAGNYLNFQSHMRHKNGHVVYVEMNAHRFANQHVQVMVNDVTARVLAEQRFAEERNFVFHALDTLPGIFYVFNTEGRFLRWNRQLEEVTGYDMEEMGRISSADLSPPERRASHRKTVAEILNGMGVEGETELYCKDGSRISYFFVARHFEWQGQNCVVGMGVDMTDRKDAERRAQVYLEEMQQLSARILEMQEDERRGLARELHDELGQGLTAALLSLKDLSTQAGTGPLVAQVSHASSIITGLTQQVRAMSLDLRPSVLDDLGLVAAVRWYLRERVESTGIHVILEVDTDLPRVSAIRETACFRVLQGALTNVLRHSSAHEVHVGLHQLDGQLVLVVHDDGQGFDVKAARRAALEGKSLGLLGMEERIRLAGGSFHIASTPGQGTEMRVELPVT